MTEGNHLREENKRQISADRKAIIVDKGQMISLLQDKIKYLKEKLTLLNCKTSQKEHQTGFPTTTDGLVDNERIVKRNKIGKITIQNKI